MRLALTACLLALATPFALQAAPLPSNRNIDIAVANDAGALYGAGASDSYYINAPGGGLNQLHISTDPSAGGVFGQVTTRNIVTSSTTGTFWITTTGGRGYNDDLILLFSMQGPISDAFGLTIKSSGYKWTPSSAGVVNPVYTSGAVDETFDKSDFRYGPNTAKPGPGSGFLLPFYSGQDIDNPATAEYLMFIDLNVGNTSDRSSTDSGSARVDFELSGIYGTVAAFNAYAWAYSADVADQSINWTNRLSTSPSDAGQSGYAIFTSAATPVPEPGSSALILTGLAVTIAIGRASPAIARARARPSASPSPA